MWRTKFTVKSDDESLFQLQHVNGLKINYFKATLLPIISCENNVYKNV